MPSWRVIPDADEKTFANMRDGEACIYNGNLYIRVGEYFVEVSQDQRIAVIKAVSGSDIYVTPVPPGSKIEITL